MCRHGEVERLDATLASFARAEAGLRLRLGQVLEVLGRGKHFELGFSSMAAYVLERCDRSLRWVEAARCLARRLEALPELRRAIALGTVSWSMGELLARVSQPHDQARWIEAAESRTVREMRSLVAATYGSACGGSVLVEHAAARTVPGGGNVEAPDQGEMCTLTCTVDEEEAWLFEATRTLLEQLGEHGADAQVEALLAEGQGTLLSALPAHALELGEFVAVDNAQQLRLQQLGRWRAEAEALCEKHFRASVVGPAKHVPLRGAVTVAVAAALGLSALESNECRGLDGMVRGLSRLLARHELELSQIVLQFHRVDGWRRLGYASEAQYACERLGMSRSSLLARRALAVRLEKLPRLAEALGAGLLGVEAAWQVARVATPSTQAAWVERARQRTIKYLREEVAAAQIAVRWSGEACCPPPLDDEMVAFHELAQAVVSGRVCQSRPVHEPEVRRGVAHPDSAPFDVAGGMKPAAVEPRGGVAHMTEPDSESRRVWLVMLGSLARWLKSGIQLSAGTSRAGGSSGIANAGRVALRLRVSRANYVWWRELEAQARQSLPLGMSWLRFLCVSLWNAWRHLLGPNVAYGQIYIRDRYRCSSPVCSRRDVTPHHLRFRSAGGSDDSQNVVAVCTWCHLFGVHGNRIRAVGTAERIRWELGTPGGPCVVVHGRERVAA